MADTDKNPQAPSTTSASDLDERSPEAQKREKELAIRLAQIIENANEQVIPTVKMIRSNIENMLARKEEDRDDNELTEKVRPLIEQVEKVLNETNGAIKGIDHDNKLTNQAKRNQLEHKATPEEQRLAEALKIFIEEVQGTIDWAKDKLEAFPKAKKDLGPLLDALGQPITQIVGGVGLLLAGVLNLLGSLLSGLGLDGFLKGIVGATGLSAIYKGLGLDKLMNQK
ncbi:hypothetical protein FIBSPDRAFT_1052861 [Athelia psychrophila]|uniref:DUF6987 domain-containing protein n=1 Tax=Athelia psychrophila TaxID=1759441 RepID=A0A165WHK4_9AGAM|nr:hypothetical protein FIBSPDRAFT_1052861 [Fibularhizoctonia sp. CBS 109695]